MGKWVVGEYLGSDGKWYKYITSLCADETLDEAIQRIYSENKYKYFRDIHIEEE